MAPIRKSRNLNKLSHKDSKSSPTKDASNGDKIKRQKRKVSDMLDKWSNDELGRFYEGYRKFGKNWKKVAGNVRTKSVEMVEELYNLNKAYLSLPEGVASVVGLISMMTDHYNSLDTNESESESFEETKISQKAHKRAKSRVSISKSSVGHVPHMLPSQTVASSYGFLSSLKGIGHRIARKRTPRIPVSPPYIKGDVGGKHISSGKQGPDSEEDVNTDEAAQEMLRALKESSFQTPNRRAEQGNRWEGNLGIRKTGNADSARECENAYEVCTKKKLLHEKKPNVSDMRFDFHETCKMNKRARQLLSEDESAALDALKTLAGPFPEREPTSIPEAGPKENGEDHSMVGEDTALTFGLIPEAKQHLHQLTSRLKKRKGKYFSSKVSNDSINKPKLPSQSATPVKQRKSVGPQESATSREGLQRQGIRLNVPMEQIPSVKQVNFPKKSGSKRKTPPQKVLVCNGIKPLQSTGSPRSNDYSTSLHDRAHGLKEKLSHSLSFHTLQRWCGFEWFYSAIDYPWFAKREFVEYLNHVGLGHVPQLTRVEWGVIRSSLGKPRRLSQQFLTEEKDKLERYRESVRTHYAQLRSGTVDAIPSDLARPLWVGQRVIARHPKTREICNGRILTVERNRCRVQFDRLELGVGHVMDIDCMPFYMADNMTDALRKENIAVDKDHDDINTSKCAKQLGHMRCARSENLESADGSPLVSSPAHPLNTLLKLAEADTIVDTLPNEATASKNDNAQGATQKRPCTRGGKSCRDADIQALSDLSRALDKKEVLVSELRYMNSEILKDQNDGDDSLKESELFKEQYDTVILQLKDVNYQVSSALSYLRQRNAYKENSSCSRLKPVIRSSIRSEHQSYFDNSALPAQESVSNVVEVVESSRCKAQKMVDAAAQAMSSLREGEDVYTKIGEALDFTDSQEVGVDSRIPAMRSFHHQCPGHDLPCQNQTTSGMAEQRMSGQKTDSNPNSISEVLKVHIPSALISSCVATLLMIQKCTEKQYPPGDAAEILESAIKSLQPSCTQNVPIYRDIQMCMGMVKNQILALIPT